MYQKTLTIERVIEVSYFTFTSNRLENNTNILIISKLYNISKKSVFVRLNQI